MKKTFSRETTITRYDIPRDICEEIGRIITRFAFAEHYAQGIVYMMVEVGPEIGRLSVREGRLEDRLNLIEQIAFLRGYTIQSVNLKALKTASSDIKKFRDLLAHGAWARSEALGCWAVKDLTGNWDQEAKKHGIVGPKRAFPEGRPVTADDLKEGIEGIDEFIAALKALRGELLPQVQARYLERDKPSEA
ncbi:MAG: hypothetical protein GC187_07480 [Alphaproteobacteria bacterium]|nr:hypothetical protein [Alphaproteobacteria bacterium]